MLPGWAPLATLALATLDPAESLAVENPLTAFFQDPAAEYLFLLETSPGTEGDPDGEMVRLSDRGFVTEPDDTPANAPYPPVLSEAYHYEIGIPDPDEGRAVGRFSVGIVEAENAEGDLDADLAKSWEGRVAEIKVGGTFDAGLATERTLRYDEFGLALSGIVEGVETSDGRVLLRLREGLEALRKPLQTTKYAGTGGMEGGDQLKGRPKPISLGELFNVAPVLVDAALLLYQVHDGSIEAIDALRDKGVDLGAPVDVPGAGNLEAYAWPGAEVWATDRATGRFRLKNPPAGLVTADVRGDNTGGYVSSTADVARRLAVVYGGLADPGGLDGASFSAFLPTDAIGFYADGERTVIDALEEILAGADGWLTSTRDARLRIGRYRTPEDETPSLTLSDVELEEIDDETALPPVYLVRVGYQRMWAVQGSDELASGVSAADRALYSEPYRFAQAEDLTVLDVHKNARELEVLTLFADEASAQDLADALLPRFAVRRRAYRAGLENHLFRREVGEVIRIESSESDLDAGRNVLTVSAAERGSDRTASLRVWG